MITAALIGNPNVGKTTLFNSLTGAKQHIGNWAGVTVEKIEGYLNDDIKIVDLPGIYAMDTYSNEEKISKQFLKRDDVDVILNIVDASNLERNLYLTTQLKQFNKPIILILNMIDAAESKGMKINYDILSKKLGVIVVPIVASKGIGIEKVKELLENGSFDRFGNNILEFNTEKETYSYIENILKECLTKNTDSSKVSVSDKIDNIVLNKFLAFPLFFLSLFIIFMFTFNLVGQPLSDVLDKLFNDSFIPYLNSIMANSSEWFRSLIVDGIVNGIGSILVFLPVILTLFLGISFLEDSGYMARAALIMDKLMRKMGLSGKAFIPMIVGFGCSVPGIMSARTLESEKDRKLTALLVPLMSCNAKIAVYALFTSIFFKKYKALIVFSLYLLGIVLAFIIGILFKNTIFKKNEEPFIIELPEYRLPDIKTLMIHTWEKGKGFVKKAGTVIFAASVIIWFLQSFNFSGMTDMNSSFLASIGKFINPIFIPLGFGRWQTSVSLLTGLMAKEVVVSSMGVIYGGNLSVLLPQYFSTLSAYSFLVFVLLYTPCISVVATMKKEYGNKMAAFSVAYQFTLAWVVSFLVYNIGKLF
ncbi:ferrous iron transport protein B [Clostridium tepidiprofundi DSM 19306]|uniref:Ferrous iron transport protein B n=1 Tax=Clostridium tepidiprofundi DSM 19306 TaxID=1121338 RepID=A0A151B5Y2_9CLOT|nr:ferrous iron transport protein B [Clostridium tepidiprofundi]KYH35334.1 ferrous iron transport protein B [Clostridium tepidiprofundi DSM 19306]